MKTVEHYICDICKTEYNNKRKCENCESGHRKPKKIIGAIYHPITINALGIPEKIEIEFDNGSKFTYKK